jgi:hypothetical protein
MPEGEHLASRLELAVVVVAIALLAVVSCAEAVRERRSTRTMAIATAAVAAIALVRGALTRWSLIHAEFCGTEILDGVFAWPTRSVMHYGVFHSLVYGGAMRLVAPDLATVAALNELLAAATLVLMAILAWAWTGSRLAGIAVVSVGLLHPVVMRVAGSEEGHNLAVLMGFVALAAVEAYRSTPRRTRLVALACAATLMIDTKQIMVASLPCVALLGYLRAPPGHRRAVLLAVSAALPMFAMRLLDVVHRTYDYSVGQRLQPVALAIAVETHPLLDPRGPIYVFLPLFAAGLVWLSRWGREGRAIIACVGWLFFSTLLLMEGQAVTMTFRLPVLTLAIVVEGIGAWVLVRAVATRVAGAVAAGGVTAALLLLLAVSPLVEPGFGVVREVSSQTREYDYLRGLALRLPPGVTFVTTRLGQRSPAFPAHLFSRVGARVTRLSNLSRADFDRGPVLFLHGLECAAYYFQESQPPGFDPSKARRSWQPGIGTFPLFQGVEAPEDPRPVCEQLIRGAAPWEAPQTVPTPRQRESPMTLYGHDMTTLQVFELGPSALAGVPSRPGAGAW